MLRVRGTNYFRMLDRRSNDDITAIRARDRAADQDDFVGFADLKDLKVLDRNSLVAEMTRHAHVFPNPAGCGTVSYGAIAPVGLGTVRCTLTSKVMLLHHALETFTL